MHPPNLLTSLLTIVLFVLHLSSANASASPTVYPTQLAVEDYILAQKPDSAQLLLSKLPSDSPYSQTLQRIISPQQATYKDYMRFLDSVTVRNKIDYKLLDRFLEESILPPKASQTINLDYVILKWIQIRYLSSELLLLDKATTLNEKLLNYINPFDSNNDNTKRAKILASTHKIVMNLIQDDLATGKSLCLENEKIARSLNDTSLIVLSLSLYSDFLVSENKLDEYISVNEQAYELDKGRTEKSWMYSGVIYHLINAYSFKGGHNARVLDLLNELHNIPGSTPLCYPLYAQFLSTLPTSSPIAQSIYEKFDATDAESFCKNITALAKETLNLNDYYHTLRECANVLANAQLYQQAMDYQGVSIAVNKKIYSQELSQNLADYETKLAVHEKELEIAHEKEKSTLYMIIMFLAGFLLLIAVFASFRLQQQTQKLKKKNIQIAEQRDAISKREAEKELLLREVNHRVKNNFQIILSLLEIQANDIQDPQALALTQEGKSRVRSMSLIHDSLFQNDNLNIPFDEYVKKLIAEISNMFTLKEPPKISIAPTSQSFDIDTAIPLGLIINELVTNAFKYGFNKTQKLLDISVTQQEKNGHYQLKVTDNGNGIEGDFEAAKTKSTGLRLVSRLARQLQGTLEYTYHSGCSFIVSFKDTPTRQMEGDMG